DSGGKPAPTPKPEPPQPPEPPRTKAGKDKKNNPNSTDSTDSDAPSDSKEAKAKKPKPEEIPIKLEFPRHRPSSTVVLRGAQVITMNGDDIISNADIVVKDNRIAAIGEHGKVSVPDGAKVIDLTGATIVPGFIDIHPHW